MTPRPSAQALKAAIGEVKAALRAGLHGPLVADLAFIGNASAVYDWVPCRLVDLDCFLFAPSLEPSLGAWLSDLRTEMAVRLERQGIGFELRIVEGPYKPSAPTLDRPVIVAHLGLFTDDTYRASAPLKRWAWRKYRCDREPDRLLRLAPSRPTLAEFVHGRRGLAERLAAITAGSVTMTEWLLPSLAVETFEVTDADVAFQECCFAYAANCARNHARALGLPEPDLLGNTEFFPWYDRCVTPSPALLELMALKAHCRDYGFDQDTGRVRALSLRFMRDLHASLLASVRTPA